jgi:putative Ca2+/H+ antiporter (TMEM165/GDT1 family)
MLAMALWTLKPDTLDGDQSIAQRNAFLATLIAFFIAEIGDKTQIATAVLGAEYQPLWQVIAGTTCGMLIADVPVVWLGARFAHALPLRAARIVAAALFVALAIWILLK